MNVTIRRRIMHFTLVIMGMSSIIVQSLLIRELAMLFYGNELSLGMIFASWLFWIGVGSWLMGRMVSDLNRKLRIFIGTSLLASVLIPIQVTAVRVLKYAINSPPDVMLGFAPMFLAPFLILAPLCIITGFQFALASSLYNDIYKSAHIAIRKIYLYDAIGDMLGGFIFGYILINFFTSFQIALYVVILNVSLSLFLILAYFRQKASFLLLLSFGLLILFLRIGAGNWHGELDVLSRTFNWKGRNLVEVASSKYSHFAIVENEDSLGIYSNGTLDLSVSDKSASTDMVHLAMTQVDNPTKILVIGRALSGQLREFLKYDPHEIYYIETDPVLVNIARPYILAEDRDALADERVKLLHEDGRVFVKQYRGEPFDCVMLNVGNPLTAELNRFYTYEFFREISSVLSEGGVFFFMIDYDKDKSNNDLKQYSQIIYMTLRKVFGGVIAVGGDELFLAASKSGEHLTYDERRILERLQERGMVADESFEDKLDALFSEDSIQQVLVLNEETVGFNYDFHPISYYYGITLWGTKSIYSRFLGKMRGIPFFHALSLVFILGSLLFALKAPLKGILVPLAVVSSAMAGIVLELILIIGFQIIYGYLYHMVGIIIASFMLGLVIGTFYVTRELEHRGISISILPLTQIAFGVFAFHIPVMLLLFAQTNTSALTGLAINVVLPVFTMIDGCFVGIIFPLANKLYMKNHEEESRVAGRLYAFDLAGACLGALIASVLFIPVWGILNTAILVGVINIGMAILIFSIAGKKSFDI
ncbi:MAG: fused MFS/spermidine synthase [bacterium]